MMIHTVRFLFWTAFVLSAVGAAPAASRPDAAQQTVFTPLMESSEKALSSEKPYFKEHLHLQNLLKELQQFGQLGRELMQPDVWGQNIRAAVLSHGFFLSAALVLFTAAFFMLRRLKKKLGQLAAAPWFRTFRWHGIALEIIRHSWVLAGFTLFVYLYSRFNPFQLSGEALGAAAGIFMVFLFTRWGIDFIKQVLPADPHPHLYKSALYADHWLRATRYFAAGSIFLRFFPGTYSTLLFLIRLGYEGILILWAVQFWRSVNAYAASEANVRTLWQSPILRFFTYTVFCGGLAADLIGLASFAVYWLVSWGKTAVILLWGGLLLSIIKEWNEKNRAAAAGTPAGAASPVYTIRWFLIRLSAIAWFAGFFLAVMFAWGAREAAMIGVYNLLTHKIAVGGINFSLIGFFYALLILLVTHSGIRLWQHLLQDKILDDSGLEKGLRNSIIAISVYLLWAAGILFALHALGLSTTTITVAFGALGIGLGFGLQNIFNNFVSGIILLFERPIQVGDALEINGVWGEVRKINVRSTVVQTYDNASLIIPNSEFVSSQVKNWSFKDLRLRRQITVGVAYGSDTELTRSTLLEIAEKTEWILKYPKPDVLFVDFGDSALIFKLRFWTDVDHMLSVETYVRFEIDRLFRERAIEIAFPQRDIHIRSIIQGDSLKIQNQA